MSNQEKGIKMQVSRPFETILDIGFRSFAPGPHWGCSQCVPRPPAACHGSLCMLMTSRKITTFLLPPKFKSCIRPSLGRTPEKSQSRLPLSCSFVYITSNISSVYITGLFLLGMGGEPPPTRQKFPYSPSTWKNPLSRLPPPKVHPLLSNFHVITQ